MNYKLIYRAVFIVSVPMFFVQYGVLSGMKTSLMFSIALLIAACLIYLTEEQENDNDRTD